MVFLFSFLYPVVIISFTFSYIFCFFTHSHTTSGHALKPLMMLVPDLLATSRAPYTVKGYLAYFHNWKDWAVKVKVSFCSASASHVSLFLNSLLQSGYSISYLIPPYSLNFSHNSCAVSSPSDSGFTEAGFEGCKSLPARFFLGKGFVFVQAIFKLLLLPDIRDVCFAGFFCVLTSFAVLDGVTLVSRIPILPFLFLNVSMTSMVLVLQG